MSYLRIDGRLVHVNIPRGHYIGQIRLAGHRNWETVCKSRSAERAMSRAVLKMGWNHKRSRVLFVDRSGWYGPTQVMECSR